MIQRTVAKSIAGRQRAISSSILCGSPATTFLQNRQLATTSFAAKRRSMASGSGRPLPFSSLPKVAPWHNRQHKLARWLSTEIRAQTAAAAAANATMAAESEAAASGAPKKKAESNVFLDNLGKIFLMGIVAVIVTLVRSTYNTSNRHLVRDRLEDIAAIDPKELEEFREANAELTLDVMRQIISIYYQEEIKSRNGPGATSTYDEFIISIRKIMATRFPKQGESFTIQTGHYLDRIIVAVLEERGEGAETENDELPVALFFAAMASAMNGSVSDRIRILHEIIAMEEEQQQQQDIGMGMSTESSINNSVDESAATVTSIPLTRVRDMVGYLQETCQLPPDTQMVPTERKYPAQQWRRATPMDMVPDISESKIVNETNNTDGINNNNIVGSGGDDVDLVEFAAILRTKSVCAWGECYMKVKPDESEFDAPGLPQDPPTMAESSIVN